MVKVSTVIKTTSVIIIFISLLLLFMFVLGFMTTIISVLNYTVYRGFDIEFDRAKGVVKIRATIPVKSYNPLPIRLGLKFEVLDGNRVIAEDEKEVLLDFGEEDTIDLQVTMNMSSVRQLERSKLITILRYTMLDLLSLTITMKMRVMIYG